jgi:hypothetical protein
VTVLRTVDGRPALRAQAVIATLRLGLRMGRSSRTTRALLSRSGTAAAASRRSAPATKHSWSLSSTIARPAAGGSAGGAEPGPAVAVVAGSDRDRRRVRRDDRPTG